VYIKAPEVKHLLVGTTDVLESGGVPKLRNRKHKITDSELSFHMN